MLNRQYGIAAPSSVVKVVHPEDSQPNEKIHGRNRNLPPRVANTARPPQFDRIALNSGERLSQFATRGSWKGKGRGRTNICRQEPPNDYARGSKTVYGHSSSGSLSSRTFAEGNSHISEDARLPFPNSYAHPQVLHSTSASPNAQAIHPPVLLWNYKSPSPKLPPEPIRRRTPLDGQTKALLSNSASASLRPLPIPLPGRKRNAVDALPSEPSPPKKPKGNLGEQQVTLSATANRPCTDVLVIKDESPPPESIPPLRKLVKEACSFWRIPDNCRKSDPHHQDNRKAFAREKIKELLKLNLKRTKVFFREDGLVVEWKSDMPVWNDNLLPEWPLSQSTTPSKKFPSASPASKPNSSKRKRAISEIINLDVLPTPVPDKRPRSSNLINVESSASNEQTEADQSQLQTQPRQSSANTPSPKKGKLKDKPEKHWAAGLSQGNIRKLGKGVQVPPSDLKTLPHPSSLNSNTSAILRSSFDRAHEIGVDVESSSTRRPALPTRIARGKNQTAATASSNPEKERERSTVNSALPSVIQSEELKIPQDVKPSPSAFNDHDDIYVDDEPSLTAQLYTESGGKEDVTIFAKEESASRKSDDTTEKVVCELSFNDGAAGSQLCGMQGMHPMAKTPRVGVMREFECDEKRNEGSDDARQEGFVADEAVQVQSPDRSAAEQDHVMDSPEYEIAVEFLQRFIQLFDTDRTQLQMAYSEDAQFSYRVHNTLPLSVSFAGLFAPESAAAMIHHGRSAIIDRLCAFGNYQFSQRGVPSKTVYYDLAALPQEIIGAVDGVSPAGDGAAILATLHSEVINPNSEDPNTNHVLTLDQSFVLRRRTDWDGDNVGDRLGISGSRSEWFWPFLIVSHQMVIRDGSLLPADDLDNLLWIKGIDLS